MPQSVAKPARRTAPLYDRDFYAWTQQQAGLLKAGRLRDVDVEHLCEEIEDLGSEQQRAVRSHLRHLLAHLVKLQYSSAHDPRRGWKDEVLNARAEIEDRLDHSPSLRPHLDELLAEVWPRARRQAVAQMANYGEHPDVPADCPFTLAQMLDDDYWPDRTDTASRARPPGSRTGRRARLREQAEDA